MRSIYAWIIAKPVRVLCLVLIACAGSVLGTISVSGTFRTGPDELSRQLDNGLIAYSNNLRSLVLANIELTTAKVQADIRWSAVLGSIQQVGRAIDDLSKPSSDALAAAKRLDRNLKEIKRLLEPIIAGK